MNIFERALAQTLEFEGGKANHKKDRGGKTNYGITQARYDKWRIANKLPTRSVDLILWGELAMIYAEYWKEASCDALPAPLATAVFDMAVHSGAPAARITLQRALGVRDDGVIGPITILAANNAPDAVLKFLKKRGDFIQGILIEDPSQVIFLENWINRLLDQSWRRGQL
jgi:lysozyme family protein